VLGRAQRGDNARQDEPADRQDKAVAARRAMRHGAASGEAGQLASATPSTLRRVTEIVNDLANSLLVGRTVELPAGADGSDQCRRAR
jgi:hypothetical protein